MLQMLKAASLSGNGCYSGMLGVQTRKAQTAIEITNAKYYQGTLIFSFVVVFLSGSS